MLGYSGIGDSFGFVKDSASENIQEITFLGGGLSCNDSAVCGGIMGLEILMR